jgi:excisionase family DNA binding protein
MQRDADALTNKAGACQQLCIKQRKLDYLRARGELPYVKIGSKVLFSQRDLNAFIARNRISKR